MKGTAKTSTPYQTSYILNEWKERMYELLQSRYPNKKLPREKVMAHLDKLILKKLRNPKLTVVNNYTNQMVRSDILTLINLIEDNQLIIGGGGTLYHQHGVKPNLLIDFILYIMAHRKAWKKKRDTFRKGTDEYLECDIQQNLYKLIINSLYGCMGYPGFPLYNIFNAEAITNQGRHIITTAISCFEGLLGDAIQFDTKTEVFTFITNISREYHEKYKDVPFKDYEVPDILAKCTMRLIGKCSFKTDQAFVSAVESVLAHRSKRELHLIYYKNNLMGFIQNPAVKSRFRLVLSENGPLLVPYANKLSSTELQGVVAELWDLIECFVFYNYPIYDRIRKAMYVDKARSLYTDTDSVFISFDHLVQYCQEDVMESRYDMDDDTFCLTAANIMMIFVNYAVDKSLKTFAASLNIKPEWASYLSMKNEFFFKKILFIDRKKRYISLALLQEGVILNYGKGVAEIKGFDFRKATTKEYLRDFYSDISLNDILYPPEIDAAAIFEKVISLKDTIETGARNGDMKFFKQAAVKTIDQYINPYQTQGVTAILFWNALCPDSELEFPNDVNIVPVIDLRWKNSDKPLLDYPNIREFAEKHPDEFYRLKAAIYDNPNPEIRHMGMKYIATPKNPNIKVPDIIYDIIDYQKLTSDATALFTSVLNSIGIKSISVSADTESISNLVDL